MTIKKIIDNILKIDLIIYNFKELSQKKFRKFIIIKYDCNYTCGWNWYETMAIQPRYETETVH